MRLLHPTSLGLALTLLLTTACTDPSEIATEVVATARAKPAEVVFRLTPVPSEIPMIVQTPLPGEVPETGREAPDIAIGPEDNEARELVVEYFQARRPAGVRDLDVQDVVLYGQTAADVMIYTAALAVELDPGVPAAGWHAGVNQRYVSLRLDGAEWEIIEVSATAPPIEAVPRQVQPVPIGSPPPGGVTPTPNR